MSAASKRSAVMVTGATGAQGGAVVRALLRTESPVSALVRDPATLAAQALERAGARLVQGDLDDPVSLAAACADRDGVFSVQLSNSFDVEAERRQARSLISAAKAAGVSIFVQTTVSGTRVHRTMPGWAEGRWSRPYWEAKTEIEDDVMAAGFDAPVVLKPAFMMENFVAPKVDFMFPDLRVGEILTAIAPATRIALVAADDIGAAAAAAFQSPDRFAGAEIDLCGERLTLTRVAAILSEAGGTTIQLRTLAEDVLLARGQFPGWVQTQTWLNVVGYPARPEEMVHYGLSPTSFADWVGRRAWTVGTRS